MQSMQSLELLTSDSSSASRTTLKTYLFKKTHNQVIVPATGSVCSSVKRLIVLPLKVEDGAAVYIFFIIISNITDNKRHYT